MEPGLSIRYRRLASILSKELGLTVLLVVLFSLNFAGFSLSSSISSPVQLVLVALADTILLSYFVKSSRWSGWREWGTVFAALFGMIYLLTAFESVYLGNVLSANLLPSLFVNGTITSGIFAAAVVSLLAKKNSQGPLEHRLEMPRREWMWKVAIAGAVYLGLFILVGFAVYRPLATILDPTGLASEQQAAASVAMLVFPVEIFRGALWALLAAPAVIALRFGWRKTALMMGLIFAVPVSGSLMLSSAIAPGLQLAHFVELFSENIVFGALVVWILRIHSRLPA